MGLTLSDLTSNVRTTTIDYFGDKVQVTYKPGELTPPVEAEIVEAVQDGDNSVIVESLARLITGWDVLAKKDGDPLQVSVKTLNTLPNAFLVAVLTGIREDMYPSQRSGRGSFRR